MNLKKKDVNTLKSTLKKDEGIGKLSRRQCDKTHLCNNFMPIEYNRQNGKGWFCKRF